VTRLTRYARGLLVAVAALALTAGAAFAARGLAPASSDHKPSVVKSETETPDVNQAETPEVDQAEAPETETPDSNTPDSNTPDSNTPDSNTSADRLQNHGWFVSQAAQATTPGGFDSHGAYVSSIAQGTDGKPAAANGAAKSAAGKAKGQAAKAAHSNGH
jgi:hypothetical protein